jgi:hypothetical protein
MPTSSPEPLPELLRWRTHLDTLIETDDGLVTPTDDQLAIENAIAAGIAVLAGEPAPDSSAVEPQRPILAKDLRITTDLVLRALEAHT